MTALGPRFKRQRDLLLLSIGTGVLLLAGCPGGGGPLPGGNPPVANAGANQVVDAGSVVILDGSASSDPDGDALSYAWTQKSGTPVTLSNADQAKATFTAPENGAVLAFELTVSDGQANSVANVSVSVRAIDESAKVDEQVQRSVTEDPAAMGNFPNSWKVPELTGEPTPAEESELEEFREQLARTTFAPIIEEDLAPGATRSLDLVLAGPAGLSASVRWIGTLGPLETAISLDGAPLATGSTYHFGSNRGGVFITAPTTTGGQATLVVTNTTDTTAKVRMVFAATGF